MHYHSSKEKAFTILELLLSVALISMLIGLSAPIFQQLQTNRNVDTEIDQVVSLTRRAQILARSGYYDDEWGIYMDSGTITLFQGDDYSTRDTDFDEDIILDNATIDSTVEVFFEKESGIPDSTFTGTFTTTNNYQITLIMNEQGVLTIS